MNKISVYCTALLFSGMAACHNAASQPDYKYKTLPVPGTVVGSAEMPVTEDTLNKFTFGIKVEADSAIDDGVYDVKVHYEYHTATGRFTMPRQIRDIKPIIRTGKEPYSYVIGFKVEGDTTFYDYFQVKVAQSTIYMDYLKGYTF